MMSAEDEEELDEAVEHYAADTTWSWVKWSKNPLHVPRHEQAWIMGRHEHSEWIYRWKGDGLCVWVDASLN